MCNLSCFPKVLALSALLKSDMQLQKFSIKLAKTQFVSQVEQQAE